jgi:VWFA-related protein
MKQLTSIIPFFLVMVVVSNTGLAQSRHNRPTPAATAGGTADASKPGAADSDDSVVDGTNVSRDPKGEAVEGDVIKVNTSLVTVPVSVSDRNGKYIPDLNRSSFHIFENNVEQKISYFATVDKPFTVALIIDTSRSTHFKLEDIQSAAIDFVQQLKPEDRVMVVSFDDHINVLSEPTSNRSDLARAIRQTRTGGSTRLYDAVAFVINQRLKRIPGRKAVVLFTDGVDTSSHSASYESTVRDAEEGEALVYTVAYDTSRDVDGGGWGRQSRYPRGGGGGVSIGLPFPFPGTGGGTGGGGGVGRGGGGGGGGGRGGGMGRGGGGSSAEEYARADRYLHDLPEKTGARFYNGDTLQDVNQAFAQVAEELRRQYSLGYYPKAGGVDGMRRQIKVRVDEPNAVVNSRDSYIYTQKKSDAEQKSSKEFSNSESRYIPSVN